MFPLAFATRSLQGHWWGFTSRNYVVWPTFLLMNVTLLLKDLISDFYLYLFGPHFDLYQSLNRLPIWNSQNCSMFSLAFVAGWLQGHWWGFISRNYVVWPIFFLTNVSIALKESHFYFLFVFTAAGVVQCSGRKTSPRKSTIVQFIFYFDPLRSARIFSEIRNKWMV